MTKICLCLTGRTLRRDIEIIEKYRPYIDIAELRVDCLEPAEQLNIRAFPEQAGLPVILTVRRQKEGGYWTQGEAARFTIFARALAFAQTDTRRNFAYIDLEEDVYLPSVEEAVRAFNTKIIRSFHDMNGVDVDIPAKIRSLHRYGDEIVKVAVTPTSLLDLLKIYRSSRELKNAEKVLIGMGRMGLSTRILAGKLGSAMVYCCVKGEDDFRQSYTGQIDPEELCNLYRFRKINEKTDVLGLAGWPLNYTESPVIHNNVYNARNINAVYIPFPTKNIGDFLVLSEEIGLRAASITVPHKETIIPHLTESSPSVKEIGACNTIVREKDGWHGYNTDSMGFREALLEFIFGEDAAPLLNEYSLTFEKLEKAKLNSGKLNLKNKKITIIGAGGAAKAAANEVYKLKGNALILNRTAQKAKLLAQKYKFKYGALDKAGATLANKYNDIIIHASALSEEDPFLDYEFSGKEVVMDLVYDKKSTPFLARAAEAGCRVKDGRAMLLRQAAQQHEMFFGLRPR